MGPFLLATGFAIAFGVLEIFLVGAKSALTECNAHQGDKCTDAGRILLTLTALFPVVVVPILLWICLAVNPKARISENANLILALGFATSASMFLAVASASKFRPLILLRSDGNQLRIAAGVYLVFAIAMYFLV